MSYNKYHSILSIAWSFTFDMELIVGEDQLYFLHPFTMTLAGGRRTGKTHFTKSLLEHNRNFISPLIETIIWFHGASQQHILNELVEKVKSSGQHIEFFQGLPQDKTIQELLVNFSGQKLIVLDDLMETACNRADVAALFTHGRHENVSVIFLTQNFFHKSKYARDISLNTDYAVLFKSTRDPSTVTHLGQQMNNAKFLKQAYRSATINPFSHLFIDMRSDTPEQLRYRSNVLGETQMVYQPI